jgi:predicted RNA-binding Zn-ribbon protein involved in translation (DUF1610 family)
MTRYEFTCSDCGARILVNDRMLAVLVSDGCPVCGSEVDAESFEESALT